MARRWFDFYSRDQLELDTSNRVWSVETLSFGRPGEGADDDSPYLMANEWIASSIGWLLRVPVPPFALMRHPGHKGMFVSLHVDPRKLVPPPDTKPDELVKRHPDVSTGIVLFDILIANIDRHEGNLLVDDPDAPTQVDVIDHDRSIFGHFPGEADQRLRRLQGKLAVTGTPDCGTGALRHCLIDHLTNKDLFEKWLRRIETIPDTFIDDICDETMGVGVTRELVELAKAFLIERKRGIRELVFAKRAEFRSIPRGKWGLYL
jgi:hypothetical protein